MSDNRQKAAERIHAKCGELKCLTCGCPSLEIGQVGAILKVVSQSNETWADTDRGLNLFPVICKNCGFTLLFSARAMGL